MSVGETSLKLDGAPNNLPKLESKIDTTFDSYDTYNNETKADTKPHTSDSPNSGGASKENVNESVDDSTHDIIKMTGKISDKEYINKRLKLIDGLPVKEALKIEFYEVQEQHGRLI